MVQMDRFVHTLNGKSVETVTRKSLESAATMKIDSINTIKRLISNIRNKAESSTWCGYPHNLLLPRLSLYQLRLN